MNVPRNTVVLAALTLACLPCFAAERPVPDHVDAAPEAPALPAMLAAVDLHLAAIPVPALNLRPSSSGVTPSLPEEPEVQNIGQPLPHWLIPLAPTASTPLKPEAERMQEPEQMTDPSMISLVEASPISGVARRMQAQRFNTDDGSRIEDFAICYRLNGRSSVQVIPGNPAPIKLPVSSLSNSIGGVVVGMSFRLSRNQ